MKIFVAASYSSKVDYETGEVVASYRDWLEDQLSYLENLGYEVLCALRADNYRLNEDDPAAAFRLDATSIQDSDVLLALLDGNTSAGVQTEIGYALALGKKVVLVHVPENKLNYINGAMVKAGLATESLLPLSEADLRLSARTDA